MNKGDDKKQKQKEDRDFTSAVGLGYIIIGAIYFACAFIAIFYFIDLGKIYSTLRAPSDIGKSISIVKDIGLLALGVIGLPLAVWRSMIANGQRTAALEQLKRTDAQLRETENNNIAKLLVDGTKLLGDDTSEAEKMAGIACLANIITNSSTFAVQAADIVHKFVLKRAVTYGGRISSYDSVINASIFAISKFSTENNRGFDFSGIVFIGVQFYREDFFSSYFFGARFENCTIWREHIFLRVGEFKACKFIGCKIHLSMHIGANEFDDCLWMVKPFSFWKVKPEQIKNCYYVDGLATELFEGFDFRPLSERPIDAPPIGKQKTT